MTESGLQALVELFSTLYVPGVTQLGEERARTLQAGAGAALHRLQDNPLGADLSLDTDNPDESSWRSLPEPEQKVYLEHTKRLFQEIVNVEGTDAIDQVMKEHYLQLASWARTADLWKKLKGDRVVLEFPGDGPVLPLATEPEATSGDRSTYVKWPVRAASQAVEDQWLSATKQVTPAGTRFLNQVISDPHTMSLPFPVRVPLQGSLSRVRVANRELDQWEIGLPISYTVGHRFSNGHLEVLHAPDPSEQVVWVTTVRLVETPRRVRKDRGNREVEERQPGKLKFKPFR